MKLKLFWQVFRRSVLFYIVGAVLITLLIIVILSVATINHVSAVSNYWNWNPDPHFKIKFPYPERRTYIQGGYIDYPEFQQPPRYFYNPEKMM